MKNHYAFIVLGLLALANCDISEAPKRAARNSLPNGVAGLVLVSGNGQTGTAGSTLPEDLKVVAFDKDGAPLAKAEVEYTVVEGNAELAALATETDSEGVASVSVQLATIAGNGQVRARLLPDPYEDTYRSVYFDFSATQDSPTKLSLVQSKTLPPICSVNTWVVRLIDQFGNGVAGVILTVLPTNLKVNTSSAATDLTTDDNGEVKFNITAATAPGSGKIAITGPGTVQSEVNVTMSRSLKWTSSAQNPLVLASRGSADVEMTLSDGCGVYANYEIYWRASDSPTTSVDLTQSPNDQTNADGKYIFDTGARTGFDEYYWAFGAKKDSDSATYQQRVFWESP